MQPWALRALAAAPPSICCYYRSSRALRSWTARSPVARPCCSGSPPARTSRQGSSSVREVVTFPISSRDPPECYGCLPSQACCNRQNFCRIRQELCRARHNICRTWHGTMPMNRSQANTPSFDAPNKATMEEKPLPGEEQPARHTVHKGGTDVRKLKALFRRGWHWSLLQIDHWRLRRRR
jgi:hypothetical protein